MRKFPNKLRRIQTFWLLTGDIFFHQTTAMMMFPIVKAPIKDHTLEEMVSFLRLAKARAKIVRTKSSLMLIFALSGNGHFMGSELWRG